MLTLFHFLCQHIFEQSQKLELLAKQKEERDLELVRQKEAKDLELAMQREARIQEEIVRSRKETNSLLLAKSKCSTVGGSGSQSHNPFFHARAPAPIKSSQVVGVESNADSVDVPEVRRQ